MELIEKIKENNLPFNESELQKIKELAIELKTTPQPKTKTEAQLFINKIKELKIYASAISEFVKEKVSQANQNHKKGVNKLKELTKAINEATHYDKVLAFANGELLNDETFTLSGTRKVKGYWGYAYDPQEIIKLVIKDEKLLPFLSLNKVKFNKWYDENKKEISASWTKVITSWEVGPEIK